MPRKYPPIEERIAAAIEIGDFGCWVWQMCTDKGYVVVTHLGRTTKAHRASYLVFNGPIPKGAWVLHRCGNKACVNPGHLYLGDRNENAKDAVRMGEQVRGERQGGSKLTAKQVISMRCEHRAGLSQEYLALIYGVTQSNVSNIVNGKTWTHV